MTIALLMLLFTAVPLAIGRVVVCLIEDELLIPRYMRVDYHKIRALESELGIGREVMIVRRVDVRGDHVMRQSRATPYPLFFVNDNCYAARKARKVI